MRILTLVPLALLAIPTLASAAPDGPPDPEARLERALDEIDATESQRTTVRAFVMDTLPTLRSYHDQADALRGELQTLFLAPTVDRAAVEDLRVDAIDLVDRASTTMLDLVVDVANVLTVDQRATLQELHERHHPGRHGRD